MGGNSELLKRILLVFTAIALRSRVRNSLGRFGESNANSRIAARLRNSDWKLNLGRSITYMRWSDDCDWKIEN